MKPNVFLLCIGCLLAASVVSGQNYSDYNQQFVDEHIYEGMPSFDNIYIRQAFSHIITPIGSRIGSPIILA